MAPRVSQTQTMDVDQVIDAVKSVGSAPSAWLSGRSNGTQWAIAGGANLLLLWGFNNLTAVKASERIREKYAEQLDGVPDDHLEHEAVRNFYVAMIELSATPQAERARKTAVRGVSGFLGAIVQLYDMDALTLVGADTSPLYAHAHYVRRCILNFMDHAVIMERDPRDEDEELRFEGLRVPVLGSFATAMAGMLEFLTTTLHNVERHARSSVREVGLLWCEEGRRLTSTATSREGRKNMLRLCQGYMGERADADAVASHVEPLSDERKALLMQWKRDGVLRDPCDEDYDRRGRARRAYRRYDSDSEVSA